MESKLSATLPEQGPEGIKTTIQATFEGPLPPPRILEDYERVMPGIGNRLMTLVEEQTKHRMEVEMKAVIFDSRRDQVAMWITAVLTLILIGLGAYLLMIGKEVAGYFSMFGPVVFNAGAYVWTEVKKRQD